MSLYSVSLGEWILIHGSEKILEGTRYQPKQIWVGYTGLFKLKDSVNCGNLIKLIPENTFQFQFPAEFKMNHGTKGRVTR